VAFIVFAQLWILKVENAGWFSLTLNDLSSACFFGATLARGAAFLAVVLTTVFFTGAFAAGAFLVVFLAVAMLVMPFFKLIFTLLRMSMPNIAHKHKLYALPVPRST
jgi:hypothetical protein